MLQRLVVVTASTAEYDSRGDRYARAAAERGHEVTVLARRRDGLATETIDPSGYRIVRFAVHAADGMPLGRLARQRLPFVARFGRPHATLFVPGDDSGVRTSRSIPGARRGGRLRRLLDWLVARLRIPLTLRAQTDAVLRDGPPADVYLAMGLWAIPAALALGRRHGGRVIYDVGDIYLEARSLARLRGPIRAYLRRSERRWAREADVLITANEAYADLLATRLGAGRPTVILNTPRRFTPPPEASRRFHRAAGLPAGSHVVLYHGGLFEERGIEQLVDAIALVADAVLVLMGYGPLLPMLERQVREPRLASRVVLLPAVSPVELLGWVASADVVAIPIQPTTLNHRYSTPSKLWEAIAVGVPVLASDLPGMAGIIRETGGGVLVDPTNPAEIARGLQDLLGQSGQARLEMHERLLTAAHDRYCWEVQEQTYLDLLGRLTNHPW